MLRNPFHAALLAATFVLVAPAAQAQWTGKAELGVLQSKGNAESTSANTKIDLTHKGTLWRHNLFFGALYGENASFATAERYEARYQVDRNITDRLSWFGALRGEKDRYSGFAYQTTASTGASYKFIDSAVTKLTASLGAGYRSSKPETLLKTAAGEVIGRVEGDTNSEPVGTLSSDFEHAFTETTKITNKLLVESGADNTAVQNDIALQVSMSEKLALAVGYAVRYNSDPAPLAKSTDTLTTINLVYNLK